eukprot:jgi/Tetstr1/440431/TSEL_028764.t1
MDNTTDNPDAYREEGLLGDWANKYVVAYLQEEANMECGALLPLDGIKHPEITYELARLRAALNVHTLDVDNKRR